MKGWRQAGPTGLTGASSDWPGECSSSARRGALLGAGIPASWTAAIKVDDDWLLAPHPPPLCPSMALGQRGDRESRYDSISLQTQTAGVTFTTLTRRKIYGGGSPAPLCSEPLVSNLEYNLAVTVWVSVTEWLSIASGGP